MAEWRWVTGHSLLQLGQAVSPLTLQPEPSLDCTVNGQPVGDFKVRLKEAVSAQQGSTVL